MTPTEKLIAEARDLCSRKVYPNGSTALMRPIIIRLCDALEETQKTIEQTWEWDMYKAAQKEIERLRKELAAYEDTGLTPEEVNACKHALMGREIAKITEAVAIWNRRVDDSGVESLQIPDGTCEAAEEETPSDWTKNKACRDAVLKTFGGES